MKAHRRPRDRATDRRAAGSDRSQSTSSMPSARPPRRTTAADSRSCGQNQNSRHWRLPAAECRLINDRLQTADCQRYIRATCSVVGSAQQYQGSFRYGIGGACRDVRLARTARQHAGGGVRDAPTRARRPRARRADIAPAHELLRARCWSASTRGIGVAPGIRQRARARTRWITRAHVRQFEHARALRSRAGGSPTGSATRARHEAQADRSCCSRSQ